MNIRISYAETGEFIEKLGVNRAAQWLGISTWFLCKQLEAFGAWETDGYLIEWAR